MASIRRQPGALSATMNTRSTVDALASELRRRILSGDAAPGEPMREQEIASEYGIGRNSVRATLQALAHEGLIQHRTNRGAFVTEYGIEDILDLYGVRTAIECEAAFTVSTEGIDLSGAVAALADLEAVRDEDPWDEVVDLDMRFHTELVRATDNPRMARIHQSITMEMRLLQAQVHFAYPQPGVTLGKQHRDILDAVRSGDQTTAVGAVRAHLDQSKREALRYARRAGQASGERA